MVPPQPAQNLTSPTIARHHQRERVDQSTRFNDELRILALLSTAQRHSTMPA
jgi:hypothetical protein